MSTVIFTFFKSERLHEGLEKACHGIENYKKDDF